MGKKKINKIIAIILCMTLMVTNMPIDALALRAPAYKVSTAQASGLPPEPSLPEVGFVDIAELEHGEEGETPDEKKLLDGYESQLQGQDVHIRGILLDKRVCRNYISALRTRTRNGKKVVAPVLRVYLPVAVPHIYESAARNKAVLCENARLNPEVLSIIRQAAQEGLLELVELTTYRDYRNAEDELGIKPNELFSSLGSAGNLALFVSEWIGPNIDQVFQRTSQGDPLRLAVGTNLGRILGALHNSGLVAGDSHLRQFVADEETGDVYRIDTTNITSTHLETPDIREKVLDQELRTVVYEGIGTDPEVFEIFNINYRAERKKPPSPNEGNKERGTFLKSILLLSALSLSAFFLSGCGVGVESRDVLQQTNSIWDFIVSIPDYLIVLVPVTVHAIIAELTFYPSIKQNVEKVIKAHTYYGVLDYYYPTGGDVIDDVVGGVIVGGVLARSTSLILNLMVTYLLKIIINDLYLTSKNGYHPDLFPDDPLYYIMLSVACLIGVLSVLRLMIRKRSLIEYYISYLHTFETHNSRLLFGDSWDRTYKEGPKSSNVKEKISKDAISKEENVLRGLFNWLMQRGEGIKKHKYYARLLKFYRKLAQMLHIAQTHNPELLDSDFPDIAERNSKPDLVEIPLDRDEYFAKPDGQTDANLSHSPFSEISGLELLLAGFLSEGFIENLQQFQVNQTLTPEQTALCATELARICPGLIENIGLNESLTMINTFIRDIAKAVERLRSIKTIEEFEEAFRPAVEALNRFNSILAKQGHRHVGVMLPSIIYMNMLRYIQTIPNSDFILSRDIMLRELNQNFYAIVYNADPALADAFRKLMDEITIFTTTHQPDVILSPEQSIEALRPLFEALRTVNQILISNGYYVSLSVENLMVGRRSAALHYCEVKERRIYEIVGQHFDVLVVKSIGRPRPGLENSLALTSTLEGVILIDHDLVQKSAENIQAIVKGDKTACITAERRGEVGSVGIPAPNQDSFIGQDYFARLDELYSKVIKEEFHDMDFEQIAEAVIAAQELHEIRHMANGILALFKDLDEVEQHIVEEKSALLADIANTNTPKWSLGVLVEVLIEDLIFNKPSPHSTATLEILPMLFPDMLDTRAEDTNKYVLVENILTRVASLTAADLQELKNRVEVAHRELFNQPSQAEIRRADEIALSREAETDPLAEALQQDVSESEKTIYAPASELPTSKPVTTTPSLSIFESAA